MNNYFKLMILLILTVSNLGFAKATNLPDISVIGNFIGSNSDEDGSSFDVQEIEFSFQHYLYPGVKTNVFAALHKDDDGEREFELEEAFVDFASITEIFAGENSGLPNVGAVVGKKFLSIGKVNQLHPEQLDFVDRPMATQYLVGGDESLAGEGAQASYLLPTQFFSQLEFGLWTADVHAEEEEEEHGYVEYENWMYTARSWNSFEISDTSELELGLSYLIANASTEDDDDKKTLAAVDITYQNELSNEQKYKLQTELYFANYGDDGEDKEDQEGGYITGMYTFNQTYEGGIRYGFLNSHGDEGDDTTQLSFIASRQLTETSKFRLQYNSVEDGENTIYFQFIFGVGPHAHVLQ